MKSDPHFINSNIQIVIFDKIKHNQNSSVKSVM